MNDVISKIEIDSFRSISKVTISAGEINVFSGLNDVGKSNVLKALNLFFNSETDFGVKFNFNLDYSKVSLAAVQRSSKKKQQVKIKIHFNPPTTFRSLQGKDLWVEKVFDRQGEKTESSSLDGTKQKAFLTRLSNTIKYYYIPALKGPDVLYYILGEVGEQKLISEKDISNLNETVNKNIFGLAKILTDSLIQTETKFEFPVLVKDFWQKLNINTKYDEFKKLDAGINPSKKGKREPLKEDFYQIPLQLRGEGIKSKFIPPLLQWIQDREPNRPFVWGIDEPENSLEFRKAQEVADLYFKSYAKKTQLFLTSHSLAFIFPNSSSNKERIFRCVRGKWGETNIELLKNLFVKHNKLKLAEELGALEIQKEVIEDWRVKENQIEELHRKIKALTRPVVYVEGKIDEAYFNKTLEVFNTNYPADIKWIGDVDEAGNERFTGKDALSKTEQYLLANQPPNKVLLFFDVDCRKPVKKIKNLFVYCPEFINDAKYKTGVEHLLKIPDGFDVKSPAYQESKLEGDKTIEFPNKKAIKEHIFSLEKKEQKEWLEKIHDILVKIKSDYLS